MTATVEKAYALGRKTQATLNVDFESSTDLHLSFELGDVHPSEISIHHSLSEVSLEIRPGCKGFVIENPLLLVDSRSFENPALDAFLERHADLRWTTGTDQELFEFFADFLISVRKIREEWVEHPLSMIKPLVMELCWRRDNEGLELSTEMFRRFLNLDEYRSLRGSAEGDRAEAQTGLARYLDRISRSEQSKAQEWSAKAYELHGIATMPITEILITGFNGGAHRDYRLSNAKFSRSINKPVTSFKTKTHSGMVYIKLEFAT